MAKRLETLERVEESLYNALAVFYGEGYDNADEDMYNAVYNLENALRRRIDSVKIAAIEAEKEEVYA